MTVWQLQILGSSRLVQGDEAFTPERRSAAALGYLALAGPTPRSRLAGLLWPDSPEPTARNNLAQALRRLRLHLGGALVEGDDPLRLAPGVAVDAADLRSRLLAGEAEPTGAPIGALLGDHDFDDLPEFAEWLGGERAALAAQRARALSQLAARHEAAARYPDAAAAIAALVQLDPVAEAPYRQLMRLHYLAGDRAAALRAYRSCREVLERELGLAPLPETDDLARRIERGEPFGATPRTGERALPIEVLRPPLLVGRDTAWARMEEAWARGQFIVLAGEAGVGKTRLALDFAASKGGHLFLEGRPGDRVVPLATSVRNFRAVFAQRPDLELPLWARRALAQVLPELAGDGSYAAEREALPGNRLVEAVLLLLRTDLGVGCFVYDDLHFADDSSINTGFYVISSSFPMGRPGGVPRWIACLRPHELSAHTQQVLQQGIAAGHTAWIELEPLGSADTASLLTSLELSSLEDGVTPQLVAALHRHSGGNPLFLLETLRDLIETERLTSDPPSRLPLPDRVEPIVRQRLARLSATAQRVVQVAAVLQSDFGLDLVARVLNSDPLALLDAWEELEQAQVFRGQRFSHDLLYEAALGGISATVAALLNRRAAEVLAVAGANPARVAKHQLAAGDRGAAGRALLAAGEVALEAAALDDAAALFERARALLTEVGDGAGAATARERGAALAGGAARPSSDPTVGSRPGRTAAVPERS